MIRQLCTAAFAAGLVVIATAPRSLASVPPRDDLGGQVRAEIDGKAVQFPSLKTDITADVQGDLATVTVIQTFTNPTMSPLNATYLFPLNKDAAVHAMTMDVGDERIIARIEKKDTARQTFEQGKREGKAAALLEQHRPNMFTQNVANLMPGQPIKVTLSYVQTVPRIDGLYQLKIPLVVGPRYVPLPRAVADQAAALQSGAHEPVADAQATQNSAAAAPGAWSFSPPPAYPPVNGLTTPATIDRDRVSIRVNLASGMPIASVTSATHAITHHDDGAKKAITLAEGRTIDNRDFLLRYSLAAKGIQAGLLAHRDDTAGTLSLMLEPPQVPEQAEITPREIVFLLDTSGSMGGFPIDASKLFMKHALDALRPSDYFRIIRFSNNATEFAATAVPATPDNLRRGLDFTTNLRADGGTDVMTGLQTAFAMAPVPGAQRILVFLSDGYVGNEAEILRMVATNIGQTRTYVFGIGTAVNHYLLAEMAHVGRGFARFVDPTEKNEDAAMAFAHKLKTTVMTDVRIDWGTLAVTEQTPAALPDLFAGDSLRVQGRFTASGKHVVKVTGLINGRRATLPLEIDLPSQQTGSATAAIPLIWARSQIADTLRELMVPARLRQSSRSDTDLVERGTTLALRHSLASQWTSFVAVSQRVVNADPASARDSAVPLPMVKGVGPGAYGQRGQAASHATVTPTSTAMNTGFSGNSAPEPETIGGLLVLLLSLLAAKLRRRAAVA